MYVPIYPSTHPPPTHTPACHAVGISQVLHTCNRRCCPPDFLLRGCKRSELQGDLRALLSYTLQLGSFGVPGWLSPQAEHTELQRAGGGPS